MNILLRTRKAIQFALDTPEPKRLNSREYYLKGWFVAKEKFDSAPQLLIVVDGISVPVVTGFFRPDVARHLNDSKAANCGFLARFRMPRWNPIVRLICRTETGDVVLANMVVAPGLGVAFRSKVRSKTVSTYDDWLCNFEPNLFWPENEVSDRLSSLPYRPLISIILPTYNTNLYFLARCIESVLDQRYAHWQLCITDDCSSDTRVLEYLREIAATDRRIQIEVHESQGGISAASNSGLAAAKGEFVALLDHDDELHPFALLELVRCLNAQEGADLIYSDEDKIDVYGHRSQPSFKPDFDMDMLLSFDYLGHLIALRRSIVLNIGGFRKACDGAQDWDLLIRAVEAVGPSAVRHISKPLYHWRMHEESTALCLDSKPYVRQAWIKVISDHVERTGKRASVEPGLFYGSTRLKLQRPKDKKIAIFLRAQDGPFQAATIGVNIDQQQCTNFYEIANLSIYPVNNRVISNRESLRMAAGAAAPSASGKLPYYSGKTPGTDGADVELPYAQSIHCLGEVPEDVFVFINRPLESVNHFFFNELVAQAMREDCGLVTGISLNAERQTIHTGLIRGFSSELVDPFAGINFSGASYMGQLNTVRVVEAISDEFFAVRREHLASVDGLSSVSASQMQQLVYKLAKNAHDRGLHVLVTPYAVATFDDATPGCSYEPICGDNRSGVSLNANLGAFEDLSGVLRGNI